ncbi:sulfite exporter TauE/SafE family protein [Amycolatopsis benzoatilytica]|uniref:sulfite exporter TauE/SafE family protein n=1 Tax=Amycolatopsis benzoatilytica TaxID=346045 RepID=UPI00038127FF|nr:sulfite exporter TauE/SafE family protein [Amycolatopsis benzoatilytica]
MSGAAFALLAAAVVLAAFVQGASGLGFALICTPVIGIVRPDLVPVTTLVLMIPLNAYIAWRGRRHIDLGGSGWITLGRVPATLGGLALLAVVPAAKLNLLVGAATVLAALASFAAPAFTPGKATLLGVGAVTGIVETATGVGGPPYALAYQHRPAAELRATVALCFLVGEIVSLAVLFATGRVHAEQLDASLLLFPALVVGAGASHFVHHRVSGPRVRVGVLGFALASGLALLVKV